MIFLKRTMMAISIVTCFLMAGMMFPQNTFASSAPDVPDNLEAVAGDSCEIELTWDEVDDATSYYIYRATSSSGTYSKIGTTDETSYTDDDEDLEEDTTYYYKVKAHNSSGTSSYSSSDSATTDSDDGDLDAPDNLEAEVTDSTSIELSWDEVDDAISYYIYRATSSSGTYSKIDSTDETSYEDEDVDENKTYYYKVCAHNSSDTSAYSEIVNTKTSDSDSDTEAGSNRLAGVDRYETAADIASSGWSTSDYAVIASGENYPDALCSTPLAKMYKAPILLTAKNTLSSQTSTQLSSLNVEHVFIIGGTSVISSSVELAIKQMGIEITRLAGTDRYETSLKIAGYMEQNNGTSTENKAVIVTGTNFPNALSIASIAAIKGYPLLLVPQNYLGSNTKAYLNSYISSTVVVGDTTSVSAAVYSQLPSPQRISGTDFYATNLAVVQAFAGDLSFDTIYLATGLAYPDALAGSALAALNEAPVFLVNSTVYSTMASYIATKEADSLIAFGGTSAIPDTVLSALGATSSGSSSTLDAPSDLDAESTSSYTIDLSWDDVEDATFYDIYRATSSTGTYTLITSVHDTSYTDEDLESDQTYYYQLKAHNSTGTSNYSSKAHATTDETDLDAPDDLEAEEYSSSEITLSWEEVDEADSYSVYSATSSTGTYSLVDSTDSTTFTDEDLEPEKTYYYKVRAVNGSYTSDYSSRASAKTEEADDDLDEPEDLDAEEYSSSEIYLSWDEVDDATSYYIYRATSSSGTYTKIDSTEDTNYYDEDLGEDTTYYYKIKARNSTSISGFSDKAYATTDEE